MKKELNRSNVSTGPKLPIKVVQFGEGNFLRAFVGYAFQKLNQEAKMDAGIAVVQPIEQGMVSALEQQDGLYTLFLKGVQQGKQIEDQELITNIVLTVNPYEDFEAYLNLAKEEELKFIISNTTEAGIAYVAQDQPTDTPPSSFPAKLAVLLYQRYKFFNGAADKGLRIIPCELINHNADTLKEVLFKYCGDWDWEPEFRQWLENHCSFHNTLVDRIVPGYPRNDIETYNQQLAYQDQLIVVAESFLLWVIEGDEELKKDLPFDLTPLDVKIVGDLQPYRTRKVRILNGAHTAMVPFGLLFGHQTVKETVEDPFTGKFVDQAIFEEINRVLPMDRAELDSFAQEVLDRFRNPFIKHLLSDIALNSISKFKVRVLPSLLEYQAKFQQLPPHLTFAFICLLRFYKGEWQGLELPVKDSPEIMDFFNEVWRDPDYSVMVPKVLGNQDLWGEDLNEVPGLTTAVVEGLEALDKNGLQQAYTSFSMDFQKIN